MARKAKTPATTRSKVSGKAKGLGATGKTKDPKERLKNAALKRVDEDKNLRKYSKATRERVAALTARMAAELAEGKDDKDLLRETTKIQTGSSRGAYNAEKLNGLVKQTDPKNVSYKKLEEMRQNGHVALGMTAVKAPMVRALSKFPPVVSKDPEVAAFVKAAMLSSWKGLVRTSMNGEDYGYLPHEKLFEIGDIEWSWVEIENGKEVVKTSAKKDAWLPERYKDINPDGVKIWLDEESGDFGGFTEKGRENMKDLTSAGKSFVYTVGKEFGNLFGNSRLARAYDPYCHYKYAEFFQGRYFERFGEPGIKVHFDPSPVINADGVRENEPGEQAVTAAVNYKGSGVVALPGTRDDNGNLLNEFDIIQDDRRGEVWILLLEFWLKQILRSLLITDRTLTQDTRLGSYGMAKAHTETFLDNLQESVESFIDQVNLYIVPQLIDLNLGKDRARAYLQAPKVNREHQSLLMTVFSELIKEEPSVRATIDALEILKELNIPTKDIKEVSEPIDDEEPEEELEIRTRIEEKPPLVAQLAKNVGSMDQLVKKMMANVEKDLDRAAEPVREKIFGYEDRMKKVALGFLKGAKVDDAGRLQKAGNESALKSALKKIDGIAEEMKDWFASKEGQRTSNYLATFGDQGIDDFEKLGDIYGANLPSGWKSSIRDEKLARGFGAGLRSFLENLARVAERTKSGIREALISGVDRHEVVDAVKRNGRFMRHAAARAIDDGIKSLKGPARRAGTWLKEQLPSIARKAGDNARLWGTKMGPLVTTAIKRENLTGTPAKQIKDLGKAAVGSVAAVKLLDEADTLPGRVEDMKTHRGYVDLTVEGPARGAYRWALWSGAGLAGWDIWKFFKGPKTTEVKGRTAASSMRYDGTLGTTEWWNAEGRKEGAEEPLQQYLFHYGDRDYAVPMPREWAEAQGLEFRKAGGE